MAIQIQGNSGIVAEVVGTAFRGLSVHCRPVEFGSLGHYAIIGETGTVAAGAQTNGEFLQARWTDGTRFACIYDAGIPMFRNAGTAFSVGNFNFSVTIARAFSVAGTGGTTLTISGNNQKMRTSMGSSLFQELRIATTAALTAGTKTLDANYLYATYGRLPATTTNHSLIPATIATDFAVGAPIPLWSRDTESEHPVVLAGTSGGEGLIFRVTCPATGTWSAAFYMKWAEVTTY